MIIQHNLLAMTAETNINKLAGRSARSAERLATGYRINRAADNAAGLSISEKMRGQIRGLDRAALNVQDGISLIQVADGALNETHSILQRMNELAVKAANDTNVSSDRSAIKEEIDQLAGEINRIADSTEFNTLKLLDGSFREKKLQVGANASQAIQLDIYALGTHGLGLNLPFDNLTALDSILEMRPSVSNIGIIDERDTAYAGIMNFDTANPLKKASFVSRQCLLVSSHENATRTIKLVQNGIELISEMRSKLGATQNRLDHTMDNLKNVSENLTDAESRIRDVDMANEMVEFSKNNILLQAGQSMLAQANQMPQNILSLLR